MSLEPINEKHKAQIVAGTSGRIKGHRFEKQISEEFSKIDLTNFDYALPNSENKIFKGNPAILLLKYISRDKKKRIIEVKSHWLGGLATANQGDKILNENGEAITGSKSDILLDITFEDSTKDRIGISIKACSDNAQMALTTCSVFCEMLREQDIDVSKNAEIGLKMFCGEDGFRPLDNYVPYDTSNIPNDRKARPERWYWEELPNDVQREWRQIFTVNQFTITKMLLQCAKTYKTDSFKPTYVLHECSKHKDIDDCRVAILSIDELVLFSNLYDSFGLKPKKISKGTYKGIDLAIHQYPHFGFIQFQPIGNKQNFSELQFNLKSNYYKTFTELICNK